MMIPKINSKYIAGIIAIVFFIALYATMHDYNIFWDARNHYFKGQAFASNFLYGKADYKDLPITKEYERYYRDYVSHYYTDPDISARVSQDPNYRRSIYQDDVHTFNWLMRSDQIEHPVLSDILATFSNIIFYEKLGWLRDDYAYRIYTLLLASILVGVIFYWTNKLFGFFPAVIATITLALTPLFWAESHFNLKDVPEAVYFTLTIWQFYYGIVEQSKKKILYSSIFAGLALGTKFNIVFLPFIILPWAVYIFITHPIAKRRWYLRSLWILLPYALIAFSLFFFSWPQLWQDPIRKLLMVGGIYYTVGIAPDYTPDYRTVFNFGTYAITWIFYSTYPLVEILGVIGIVAAFRNLKKNTILLLLLLWMFIPILRASLPFTSIFGGVRHIMEYIPALSMLTGYGVYVLINKFSKKTQAVIVLLLLAGFIPLIITLVKLHPAENVYFNSFIGGLSGAKKAGIPGWGYNDGGIYRKATVWLNEHAEKNSHVATAFSEPADFYLPELRTDLLADNQYSGYLQKGEYVIALTHDTGLDHTYRVRYLQNTLTPVYQYVVDGVPLIKIFKNDKENKRVDVQGVVKKEIIVDSISSGNELRWDLGQIYQLELITINFELPKSCSSMVPSNFQISEDNDNWEVLPETYPGSLSKDLGEQPKDGILTAPVPNLFARYVVLVSSEDTSCVPKSPYGKFVVFKK